MSQETVRAAHNESSLKKWWRRNKGTVLFVGGVLLCAGCGYGIYNKRTALFKPRSIPKFITSATGEFGVIEEIVPLVDAFEIAPTAATKAINGGKPFDVVSHTRILTNGRKANPHKREEAALRGITLQVNETLVDAYTKNVAC